MKTFIIASDFSKEAENATQYAIDVAKKINAKLVLFHIHVLSVHTVNARFSFSTVQELIDKQKTQVELRVKKLSEKNGIDIELDFAMGNFYEQLKLSVKQHDASLVFMGMNEKSFEEDLLGSTTTTAIYKIEAPILAIPLKAKFKEMKKILFACDVKKGVTLSVLEQVKQFSKKFDAELEVFYVEDKLAEISSQPDSLKTLSDELEGLTYMFKSVQSDAIINEIKNELIRFQPNVLIMVPYEYGFWSSLVHKSKTRSMASGMNIPLLSIRV